MLFKVFHRTLEFNLLLPISLITASFLVFSISRTTLFLAFRLGRCQRCQGRSKVLHFKSLMRLLTFRLFKGRYVTVK